MDLPPYDEIPGYSASLSFYGLALLKHEFDTPWQSSHGPLKPVVLELNSNQLNIYEFADKAISPLVEALFMHQNYDDAVHEQVASDYLFDGDAYGDSGDTGPTVFSKLKRKMATRKTDRRLAQLVNHPELAENGLLLEPTGDIAAYNSFSKSYRGRLMHSFTLQNLQVGEAPSVNLAHYKEEQVSNMALLAYRNALRLRVEHRQILLHLWSFHGMVHWFRNLCIGRDLGSLLDNRVVSKLKSIPRNFSASNNALLAAAALEALSFPQGQKITLNPDLCACGRRYGDQDSIASSVSTRNSLSSGPQSTCTSTCTSVDTWNLGVEIAGVRITCHEDHFTPVEKQYISSCIPTLNSYDKWVGAQLTLSNYTYLLPKNDAHNVNENGRVFISQSTFGTMVKNYSKRSHALEASNKCMEFHVEEKGLVSVGV